MSEKSTDVRRKVEKAYTQAIETKSCGAGSGCCGPAADMAGYDLKQLATVPSDAAQSSFGCGNPLALAGVEEGQTVLDLGAGAGLDLLIAAQKVGETGRVIGVDMTDKMIEAAERNIARAGAKNVEVRKGIIEDLPVEDSSVDWVISNCVINLSPEKPKVFAEIARVLKPGGRISISDIVAEELPEWVRRDQAAYAACIAGAISEGEYVAGLRAAGLTDVTVTERLVYDYAQLHAIVGTELTAMGVPEEMVERGTAESVGKVWSARFTAVMP